MTRSEIIIALNLASRAQVERAFEGVPIPNKSDTDGTLMRHHVGSLCSKNFEDGAKFMLALIESTGWEPGAPEQPKPRIIIPGGN